MRRVENYEDPSLFITSTNMSRIRSTSSAWYKHIYNFFCKSPAWIKVTDSIIIRMPHRCVPWSKSEVVWQPQPNCSESGFLHLKDLDIALAVSSGVAYRCRQITLEGPARLHQLRNAWKRWHCPCLHTFSLKASSVEVFDWARFQFNSYNSSSNVNEPSGRLPNLLFFVFVCG